ncbi:transposase [Methylomonas methanica]|uniref:transposase n=1 Tax=Methylomonas methanica TaxID=421 RepID=UPI001A9F017A|nr:transposase [Methylomonas methanica]
MLRRVMGVGTSAYYAWCAAVQGGDQKPQDQQLIDKVRQIFTYNKPCFGSRRLADRLQK